MILRVQRFKNLLICRGLRSIPFGMDEIFFGRPTDLLLPAEKVAYYREISTISKFPGIDRSWTKRKLTSYLI